MRDQNHGAVVRTTRSTRQHFRVEVAGGLVEDEAGALQHQSAQRDTSPLTTREFRHRLIAGRHAQSIHRDFYDTVEIPGVHIDLILQRALLLDEGVHFLVR